MLAFSFRTVHKPAMNKPGKMPENMPINVTHVTVPASRILRIEENPYDEVRIWVEGDDGIADVLYVHVQDGQTLLQAYSSNVDVVDCVARRLGDNVRVERRNNFEGDR